MASAVHNTQIFRKVFKSVPDDTVTTWSEYKAFMAWYDRLSRSGSGGSSGKAGGKDGPTTEKVLDTSPRAGEEELSSAGTEAGEDTHHPSNGPANGAGVLSAKDALRDDAGPGRGSQGRAAGAGTNTSRSGAPTRDYPTHIPKAPSFDDGFTPKELEQMEALLEETRGHLVLHPTRFLEAEDLSNNFLFAMDRINPLNVYD